jgi:hypothetical protein
MRDFVPAPGQFLGSSAGLSSAVASASDLPDTEFITQNMAAAIDAEALAAFTETIRQQAAQR